METAKTSPDTDLFPDIPGGEDEPLRVVLIDAFAFRCQSLDHQEFGSFAVHCTFPDDIPEGEIWIDQNLSEAEHRYFLINAQAMLQAREAGFLEEACYERGLTAGRKAREASEPDFTWQEEKRIVSPDLSPVVYATVEGIDEPLTVLTVDGELVRDFKTDFSQGGNPAEYAFIPRNEIWIENTVDFDEIPLIVLHEFSEWLLMTRYGWTYDGAHSVACKIELAHRPDKFTVKDVAKLSPQFVEAWLTSEGIDTEERPNQAELAWQSYTGKRGARKGQQGWRNDGVGDVHWGPTPPTESGSLFADVESQAPPNGEHNPLAEKLGSGTHPDTHADVAEHHKHLAREEYKAKGVRAKAFTDWFGPWETEPEKASKVVDKETGEPKETHEIPGTGSKVLRDGKPAVVYHGTARGGFTAFDKSKISSENLFGPGFYFTEEESIAKEYQKKDATNPFDGFKSLKPSQREDLVQQWLQKAKRDGASDSQLVGLNDNFRRGFVPFGDPSYLLDLKSEWDIDPFDKTMHEAADVVIPEQPTSETKTVYLNIRKPFDMDRMLSSDEQLSIWTKANLTTNPGYKFNPSGVVQRTISGEMLYAQLGRQLKFWRASQGNEKKQANAFLASTDYDGITHIGGDRMGGGKHHRVWIAFSPNQIKSVENAGSFSPDSDDINLSWQAYEGKRGSRKGQPGWKDDRTKEVRWGAEKPEEKAGDLFPDIPDEGEMHKPAGWEELREKTSIKPPHEMTRADLLKHNIYPPNNSLTPWEGDVPPVGSWRIDPDTDELEQLKQFDPHGLKLTEAEREVENTPQMDAYTKWAAAGKQAPPITVVNHIDTGEPLSINRRRVMAARAAGVPVLGWHLDAPKGKFKGQTHKEAVASALNYGKIVPPDVLADYPDLKQPEASQEEDIPHLLAAAETLPGSHHNLVKLSDLRKALPHWPREKFDAVVKQAWQDGHGHLSRLEGRGTTPEDTEGEVDVGGEKLGMFGWT